MNILFIFTTDKKLFKNLKIKTESYGNITG